MSDLRAFAQQQNVNRASDGTWVALRSLRDGAAIVCPWYQALVLEGRVFHTEAPNVGAAGLTIMTTYADTSKTLFVDIPDGTASIPLKAQAGFQATGAAVDNAYAFTSDTLNGTGGTETALTPINARRDAPITSGATVAHTADSETDTVTGAEYVLSQFSTSQDLDATSIFPTVIDWSVAKDGFAPVILDAGSFNIVMFATTSGTGRVAASWAELSESVFV